MTFESETINAIVEEKSTRSMTDKVNELTAVLLDYPIVEMPLVHTFTEGLYTRKIFMPAGTMVVSQVHNSQHQFFVMKGAVSVWIDEGVEQYYEAGDSGITEPGTQRVLYIWEDCYWVTSHPNPDNLTVEEIEEKILDKIDNPYLDEKMKGRLLEIKQEIKNNSITI